LIPTKVAVDELIGHETCRGELDSEDSMKISLNHSWMSAQMVTFRSLV
jgi:hypothetical protein